MEAEDRVSQGSHRARFDPAFKWEKELTGSEKDWYESNAA